MTNQSNEIVIRPTTDAALAKVDRSELSKLAALAIECVTGPKNAALTQRQATQIALLSLTTGLSFLTGELYWTDTGPQIGVLGYERKANEFLQAYLPGTDFHVSYREAIPNVDADFDPNKGDVAFMCVLTRDDWDKEWQKAFSENLRLMKEAGLSGLEAVNLAKELTGQKHAVEYVGVVDHREAFSGDEWIDGKKTGEKRPEMFDRFERARKRARKGAIKHAFPRLEIPDPLEILGKNIATRLIASVEGEVSRPRYDAGGKSEMELLKEVGFNGQDKQQGNAVIIETDAGQFAGGQGHRFDLDLDYQESDFDPAEFDSPFDDEVDAAPTPLELAKNMLNSKGQRYGDLDRETLSRMGNTIAKKLKMTDLPAQDRKEYQAKADAIKLLLA